LPATLTVTAASTNRVFGQTNPVFTGVITGLTNGDNITATYSCSATSSSPVASYLIMPSLVDPNDLETNYMVNLVNGTLTVNSSSIAGPVIQTATRTGSTFTFTWSSTATQTYQAQYATNLNQIPWINLGSSIVATNSTTSASDSISGSAKFYRVLLLP